MTTINELKELDAKATSAIDNLKHNQGQLDMDGCMVSVSRQAVYETNALYLFLVVVTVRVVDLE